MGKRYRKFRDTLKKYGLEFYYVLVIIVYFFIVWMPQYPAQIELISSFFFAFMPFVLPVLLWQLAWTAWLEYTRQLVYYTTEHSLLEIRLPDELTQSPVAAELFIRSLYQTGEVDGIFDAIWRGKTKPWFSLEIVSTEGVVRFYIWTRSRYKGLIESQIYAHYPTVQVIEVPDYTLKVPYDPAIIDVWGVEQTMQKPDPYPITTYVEQKLDKADTKEEFKQDALISILEFFGTMREGEHAWLQFIIRAHTECPWSEEATDAEGNLIGEEISVVEWSEKEIEKYAKKSGAEEGKKPNFMALSEGDKLAITSMQFKQNKQMFDVGIRAMYVAHKDKLDGTKRAGFPTTFRSFEHGAEGRGLNGFKPIFYIGPFDYPWQDFMGIRKALLKRKMYRGYVTRQIFYAPFKSRHIALNLEEIATVFHFPGQVAHTPTLDRMLSRRAEAPSNLPT